MNQLSDKDLELAKKHGEKFEEDCKIDVNDDDIIFTTSSLAAFLAERDAEKQPNVEAVCSRCNGSGEQLYLVGGGPDANDEIGPCSECNGTGELFTHAPSQGITRERLAQVIFEAFESWRFLSSTETYRDYIADAILSELNQALETKL